MEQEKQTSQEPVKKLEIDKPEDFKFHAAYIVYSKTWDENSSEEVRGKLNDLMASLKSDNEDSCASFYGAVSQFRKDSNPEFRHSGRIKVQSKREYKRTEAKANRTSRYRR